MESELMKKQPKILLFDIETSPNLSYVWGKWEQNILSVKEDWYMISFAWKWLSEKKTQVLSLPDYKDVYKKNKTEDTNLVYDLWKLFDEADIIIAHNGNSFDIKKANALFVKHGFPPPSPYKTIDTKLVAKKYFRFDSNSLNDLGQYLRIGEKLKTGGFDLWLGCIAGDKKAWKTMCDYNKQDVVLLEKVYLKMLPYMTNHPNLALMRGEVSACPNCASKNVSKEGFNYTRSGKQQQWSCKDCRSWHNSPLKEGSQVR